MVKVGDTIEDVYSNKGIVYAINGDWIYFIDSFNFKRACTRGCLREICNND